MGRNFELNDVLPSGCPPRRVYHSYHHHYHLYFFFPFPLFLKKIIWYIMCLVLGGWKEDLIPLLFGSVRTDRPFGWAAKGSGLKSAPLRFACIGKVSFWAQTGFCMEWKWAVELYDEV